jgi:tetratricopeptide (TPR) repeat protein
MQLAEQAEPELTGPQQGLRLQQLQDEHDNLRAALSWTGGGHGCAEQRLRIAGALWRFWQGGGNLVEGQKFLAAALEQAKTAAPRARARGFGGLGALAWMRGGYKEAIRWHEQALALYREIADAHGIALALFSIGSAHIYQLEYAKASLYLNESLALTREIRDRYLLTLTLTALGELARYQGDYTRAQALHEEAKGVGAEMQNPSQIALSTNNLGLVALQQGDFRRALQLLQSSLKVYRTVGEVRFVPDCLEGLAAALTALEQPGKAAVLLGAANALRVDIGLPIPPIERAEHDRVLESVRADLQDNFQKEFATGHAMTMEQAIDYALSTTD